MPGAAAASPAITTDARKLRSRDALYAAFLKLLERKNLDQISIREIAAAAGVGHATSTTRMKSSRVRTTSSTPTCRSCSTASMLAKKKR